MSRKPVIYISGPITGVERYWEAFEAAENKLQAAGFAPLSPAWLPGGMSNEQYMTINIAQIHAADAIYFLPGSYKSAGAVLEHHYASYIGKPTFHNINELKEFFEIKK